MSTVELARVRQTERFVCDMDVMPLGLVHKVELLVPVGDRGPELPDRAGCRPLLPLR